LRGERLEIADSAKFQAIMAYSEIFGSYLAHFLRFGGGRQREPRGATGR
jgi:hypothetical protein